MYVQYTCRKGYLHAGRNQIVIDIDKDDSSVGDIDKTLEAGLICSTLRT